VSVFRQFVSSLKERENYPKLRLVHPGGETISSIDFELYTKKFPQDCIYSSGLGTTEITIGLFFGDKTTKITGTSVPAGYPLEGLKILLLDDALEEVGSGEVGEIAIKSRYMAQGYWNEPALTEAAFLPDPDGGKEGIYLTGDLGRMLPDGCLEHLGRKDFQVKIRGYRVEVAEVEMALLELTSIKETVVVAREVSTGGQRLVAYLVPATEPAPSIGELRNYLKGKLPDYMVPPAFVFLDALPALPNGKIDRRGLPAPGSTRPELDIPFAPPRTSVEESMVDLLRSVRCSLHNFDKSSRISMSTTTGMFRYFTHIEITSGP